MKLSVIIVNYNVKFFLEQCLFAVEKAIKGIEAEIIVVDNNSVDGSVGMIQHRFPNVILIANLLNVGFSKANNQALKCAKGEYVLLLNPDTVIEENSLSLCMEFMDKNPMAGALGPKMIDGKANYLPESKRGLPTPEVAFYKIFGLTRLFPKSRKFGRYYLGHTNQDEIQIVDVLTGAFMFIRKSILDDIGHLDENFFMYGEDIDLSYRITKAGYVNYYFPKTTIIHYKGESTRKGSLNYVLLFYKAMQIFAEKHFIGNSKGLLMHMINLAIYLKAAISLLKRVAERMVPVFLDAAFGYAGFIVITKWWEKFHFGHPGYYHSEFIIWALPFYILIWVIVLLISGGYRIPFNIFKSIRGIILGAFSILVIYAVLPDEYRFSRALIFLQTGWMLCVVILVRYLLSISGKKEYRMDSTLRHHIAIVGSEIECQRVMLLLTKAGIQSNQIYYVYPGNDPASEFFSCTLNQLPDIIMINLIQEVIFCAEDLSSKEIIAQMVALRKNNINFKIASPDSLSVIGSNSSNTSGDIYSLDVNSILYK